MAKTILITGSSSGFGFLSAKKFQAEGWNVVATMRTTSKDSELAKLDNVLVCRLDVTDRASIKEAVAAGLERFGRIDVLFNNAGFGIFGPVEAATDEQLRRLMDVNYFGLVDVMKAVLPHMRERREGLIINMSSVGGRITYPYTSAYHGSKFAVEGITEAMQYEVNPLGIRMKLIEPGAFGTSFTSNMVLINLEQVPDYQTGFNGFVARMQEELGSGQQDPQDVANLVFEAATDGTDKLRYPVGADALGLLEARGKMDHVAFKIMLGEQMGVSLEPVK
ncbi:MAG: SDR family oxidoreductase [Myxococcota bacterium]